MVQQEPAEFSKQNNGLKYINVVRDIHPWEV